MVDNRLIRSVMLEAMEMRGKVKWLRDLEQSLGELRWKLVSVEDMRRLSSGEYLVRICTIPRLHKRSPMQY